jgi:hypothetical protein
MGPLFMCGKYVIFSYTPALFTILGECHDDEFNFTSTPIPHRPRL